VPIALEKHEFLEQMGRFALRDEDKTIAVGKVLKYKPVKVFPNSLNNPACGINVDVLELLKENKNETQIDTQTN